MMEPVSAKRARKEKSSVETETLERYFAAGMTSYGTPASKKAVESCAEELNLSVLVVKQWINNRSKKERGKGKEKKKEEKVYMRKPSAYDIYRKEVMKGSEESISPEYINSVNSAWTCLEDDEKKKYKEKAKSFVMPAFADMSTEQQNKIITSTRDKIITLCHSMADMGVEMAVLDCDNRTEKRTTLSYGSKKGMRFTNERELPYWFTMFNYSLTMGRYSRVRYRKIERGEYIVHGLPPGFKFRSPTEMSMGDLCILRDNMKDIVFTQNPTTTATASQTNSSAPLENPISTTILTSPSPPSSSAPLENSTTTQTSPSQPSSSAPLAINVKEVSVKMDAFPIDSWIKRRRDSSSSEESPSDEDT